MSKYNIKITSNAENIVRGDNVNITINNGIPPKGFTMPHIPTPEELGMSTEDYTLADSTTITVDEGSIQVMGQGTKIYKNGKRIF